MLTSGSRSIGDPHVGELAVHGVVDRVQAGAVERDPQHAGCGPVEGQIRKRFVAVGHDSSVRRVLLPFFSFWRHLLGTAVVTPERRGG